MFVDDVFDAVKVGGVHNGQLVTVIQLTDDVEFGETEPVSPGKLATRVHGNHATKKVLLLAPTAEPEVVTLIQELQFRKWEVRIETRNHFNLGSVAMAADWVTVRVLDSLPIQDKTSEIVWDVQADFADIFGELEKQLAKAKVPIWVAPGKEAAGHAWNILLRHPKWGYAPAADASVFRYRIGS